MAEWTGFLYFFETNKPIDDVFAVLKNEAASIGYKFDYNDYFKLDGNEALLFYRDELMMDYHLEHGYNTNLNGEGCFCVEAYKVDALRGMATLYATEPPLNFDPYNAHLIFDNIFSYRLVVPGIIEDCTFSQKIYQLFKQILAKV